jgi:cysteine-rich repeat protein
MRQLGSSGARAVALLCVLGLSTPCWAISSTVPDDFPTIQAALNVAAPGDTVSVKDTAGPYHEKITFPTSGTPGAYVTLQAFPGYHPILDGTGIAGSNMVLIDTKSYVKLIGFEIRNNLKVSDGSGIRVLGSGSHIELRNNEIHDIRGSNAMGITVYGTAATSISNLLIDGNQIHDCEPARSEALTLNGNVEQFEVTNNVVRDVNNIGIDFIGGETSIQPDSTKVARNGVCRGNQVYRARSIYGGGYAGAIYVDGGKDIVIERNTVSQSDLGIEIGAENPGIVASGVIVRDNLVYHNDKVGIAFGGYAASVGRVKNCSFLNNTCYQNDTLNQGLGELWIQYAEDNVIRNNLFYSTAQNVLLYSEAGNVNNALDYNLWFADAGAGSATFVWQSTVYGSFAAYRAGSGEDANSVFVDPQLLNPAAANFHLQSASPAVNAGDPAFVAGGGETDIDGAARVSGGRVDIGADEVTCGDHVVDPGEACDDGNLTDCDGCDSNCTVSGCGNGIVCPSEQCDDGNTVNGDCCSATCQFEAPNAPCNDQDLCTINDACDGAGACRGTAAPEPVCRQPTVTGASSLLLTHNLSTLRDQLVWQWTKGAQTNLGDFGTPQNSTGYTLCLYDQSANPQPLLHATVPAGGTCGRKACWAPNASGYRYSDRGGTASGLLSLQLKAGEVGKARVSIKGKGANLPLPTLGLIPSVTVQLKNGAGVCWGATYTTPITNRSDQFKAKSD